MVDGILEEVCRARGPQDIRGDVFKKWQQYFRNELDPKIARLEADNASLREQVAHKGKRVATV